MNKYLFSGFFILIACNTTTSETQHAPVVESKIMEIPVPLGFERVHQESHTFGFYLRKLSIKKDEPIRYYNGETKPNQSGKYAVVQFDVGTRDLQQCADAAIRLRSEYLFQEHRYADIKFHFTSGHLSTWLDYASGKRPQINGSDVRFVKTAQADSSYACFRKYLDLIFTYCGTASLQKDVSSQSIDGIMPGNLFLQQGRPYGHAISVVDVAKDNKGNRIFLLAQSYMPAQSIHILKNLQNPDLSPWFSISTTAPLITPDWSFTSQMLFKWK